jgi:hypothetical protein
MMPARVTASACALALLAALGGCGENEPSRAIADASGDCARPYSDDSPWNRPVGAVRGRPARLPQRLTSDPTQYTYPVYEITRDTPRKAVRFDLWYSRVVDGGRRTVNVRGGAGSGKLARVPIPPAAEGAAGTDGQVILLDRERGTEWNLWQLNAARDGTYDAANVGRYNTAWSAVPPHDGNGQPYFLRGAKIPYLAGLVRPCEIARGRIDHALAFAYPGTTSRWVYPATDSDGGTPVGAGLPMGTRLQLDPTIDARTIEREWKCTGPCLTIARALQRYGMYLIDTSGRSKLIVEYEGTARWQGAITASTPSPIPRDRLRIVPPPSRRR